MEKKEEVQNSNTDTKSKNEDKVDEEAQKKLFFRKEFVSLTKECRKLVQDKFKEYGDLSSFHEIKKLDRFIKFSEVMEVPTLYIYFEKFYEKYGDKLLSVLTDDSFLKNDVVIQFAEFETGPLKEKCKDVKILLSDFYNMALEIQSNAKMEMYVNKSDENIHNLIRPNILILHLLRLCYIVSDDLEKTKIARPLTKLEKELGIRNLTHQQESKGNGFETLFNNFASIISDSMGIQIPANLKVPPDEELLNKTRMILSNEKAQKLFKSFAENASNKGNLENGLKSVIKNFGYEDPDEFIDILKKNSPEEQK